MVYMTKPWRIGSSTLSQWNKCWQAHTQGTEKAMKAWDESLGPEQGEMGERFVPDVAAARILHDPGRGGQRKYCGS